MFRREFGSAPISREPSKVVAGLRLGHEFVTAAESGEELLELDDEELRSKHVREVLLIR